MLVYHLVTDRWLASPDSFAVIYMFFLNKQYPLSSQICMSVNSCAKLVESSSIHSGYASFNITPF